MSKKRNFFSFTTRSASMAREFERSLPQWAVPPPGAQWYIDGLYFKRGTHNFLYAWDKLEEEWRRSNVCESVIDEAVEIQGGL